MFILNVCVFVAFPLLFTFNIVTHYVLDCWLNKTPRGPLLKGAL